MSKVAFTMKHLSSFVKSSFACGALAVAAMVSSCESSTSLAPVRAAERLAHAPVSSVFSHNDVNSPRLRDCYEAGPLPERTRRALVTWLHNSTIKEYSYVNPQYYVTLSGPDGRGESAWALCSDNRGNLVGVLVPRSATAAAWDLPTIGSYKLFVCETSEKEALSTAIMESLADAGYDNVRIGILKATGVTERHHLISKPLNVEEQRQLEQERKERAQALADAKKKAREEAEALGTSTGDSEDDDDSDDTSSTGTGSSSDDSDMDDSSSDTDEDDSSSSDDSDDSSSDDDDDL